jgi:hypothetical protein
MDDDLATDVAPYRSAQDTLNLPHAVELPRDLVERVLAVLVDRRAAEAR